MGIRSRTPVFPLGARNMLILGKDSNDKGSQLEQIAQTMLSSKGYENIKLRAVGPGEAEYDVTVYIKRPSWPSSHSLRMRFESKGDFSINSPNTSIARALNSWPFCVLLEVRL